MKPVSWKLRGALLVTVLAAGAIVRPGGAQGDVHGLWVNDTGQVACGADCVKGQQCCRIVILPEG